jgi:hypothetical protein
MLNNENVPTAMVAIATAYGALPDPSRPHVLLTDHDMLAEVEATNGLLTGKTLATMKPLAPAPPGHGHPHGAGGGPGAGAAGGGAGSAPPPGPLAMPTPGGPVAEPIVAKAVSMLRTGGCPCGVCTHAHPMGWAGGCWSLTVEFDARGPVLGPCGGLACVVGCSPDRLCAGSRAQCLACAPLACAPLPTVHREWCAGRLLVRGQGHQGCHEAVSGRLVTHSV